MDATAEKLSRRTRLARWYYDRVDLMDPMRYVHGLHRPFSVCGRTNCWCNFQIDIKDPS